MSSCTLESLPNEVIYRILSFVSEADTYDKRKKSIQNVHLVSRRLSILAYPFLISTARVRLSSKSLSHFEQLCNHPVINKCIKHVEISALYYDTRLARDRDLYNDHCGNRLARILKSAELSIGLRKASECRTTSHEGNLSRSLPNHLGEIDSEDLSAESAAIYESVLSSLHEEYKKRTADQEHLRQNNHHIDRLCSAITKLNSLKSICWTNTARDEVDAEMISLHNVKNWRDPGTFAFAVAASGWNGSFATAYITKPPLEMLGELLSRLGESGIRPSTVKLDMSLPVDLRRLYLSEKQTKGIQKLVSETENIDLVFHSWAQGLPLAGNSARSRDEMQSLGSVTMALTSAAHLRTLRVSFAGYVWWYELSSMSLTTFLPLSKWPDLERLDLSYLPCSMGDFIKLSTSNKIKSFFARALFLESGHWGNVVDILRRINTLKEFSLVALRGGNNEAGKVGCNSKSYNIQEIPANSLELKVL